MNHWGHVFVHYSFTAIHTVFFWMNSEHLYLALYVKEGAVNALGEKGRMVVGMSSKSRRHALSGGIINIWTGIAECNRRMVTQMASGRERTVPKDGTDNCPSTHQPIVWRAGVVPCGV